MLGDGTLGGIYTVLRTLNAERVDKDDHYQRTGERANFFFFFFDGGEGMSVA